MCSSFKMDNYQGDLTDIVRACGGAYGGGGGGGADSSEEPISDWNFPAEPINFSSTFNDSTADFGHPFSSVRDPLLHELDITSSSFLIGSSNSAETVQDKMNWPPSNIFSRLLQISPASEIPLSRPDHSRSPSQLVDSPGQTKASASASASGDMINADNLDGCSSDPMGIQISSLPNPIGIKRRKSQAKKVLCIPAPAAANNRQSGEVVPSDLWAWRKYGQKPIKGSPYPRGYYRCSSSKGCLARKQVERSRTDPNMLVITYTSEHNHPWPTQRNALAGSSRTSTSKTAASSKSSSSSHFQNLSSNEEQKEISNNDDSYVSTTSTSVKEETDDFERGLDFDESEGFFEDLELERDPLDVLLSHGFNGHYL